jgi:thiol-disulfide isomerase/thioredoxin
MLRVLAVCLLCAACSAREPPTSLGHVEVVAGPADGDLARWIGQVRRDLAARGRVPLVYEGATWCEPCKRFHDAVDAGKLDGAFPTLTLLEFDADRDGERLAAAGYAPKLIPYFAAPGAGVVGGVKGDGAVDQITARLAPLVASP